MSVLGPKIVLSVRPTICTPGFANISVKCDVASSITWGSLLLIVTLARLSSKIAIWDRVGMN
jgi:hypothetical protein